MGSEVIRLRSYSQEQDSDWIRISRPTAGPLRPGLESVARLITSLFPSPHVPAVIAVTRPAHDARMVGTGPLGTEPT
jgi:hypothetical protein